MGFFTNRLKIRQNFFTQVTISTGIRVFSLRFFFCVENNSILLGTIVNIVYGVRSNAYKLTEINL